MLVAFEALSAEGVPRLGVTSVGEPALTIAPVPVGAMAQSNPSVPEVVTGEPVPESEMGHPRHLRLQADEVLDRLDRRQVDP